MSWVEKHLNWTYGIALIIGLVVFILGLLNNSLIGYIVYVAIIWIGGGLVLWRKKDYSAYRLFILLPVFAILVLCSHNKRNG
jgi:hypothetical protein